MIDRTTFKVLGQDFCPQWERNRRKDETDWEKKKASTKKRKGFILPTTTRVQG